MNEAKGSRRTASAQQRLKAEEAGEVLRRLLSEHPDLEAEAEAIARSHLRKVGFDTIADQVEKAVCALDLDDLGGRAGPREWGYVEPSEAAWEILEEAVNPFIEDVKRRKALGLATEALEVCKGVVLGLHRVEHGKGNELAQWAPDFPAEAGHAIEAWRGGAGRNQPVFPREFVERFVPKWRDMITRISSRKGELLR